MKIASLPSRPTAPASFGGKGFTSAQMKAAFDRLPLFIIERLNGLIDDILATGDDSLAGAIATGISAGHSLSSLFADITDGSFSSYLALGDEKLADYALRLDLAVNELTEKVAYILAAIDDPIISGGTPAERAALAISAEEVSD